MNQQRIRFIVSEMVRGEPETADPESIRNMLVRHVLANGSEGTTRALLSAYVSALEERAEEEDPDRSETTYEKLRTFVECERIAVKACQEGFLEVMPNYPRDRVLEASYEWPDSLPMTQDLLPDLVAEIFFAIGYRSGHETKAWFLYNQRKAG